MKLSKRYFRNMKENLSFYIVSSLLTVVTLLIFFLYTTAGNSVLTFTEDFFARNQVEDAHFITYKPIPDEEMRQLESDFDVVLEAESYINLETDGTTARLLKANHKIDLCEMTVGEYPVEDSEIAISEGYAVYHGIQVGDKIKIQNTAYTVSGMMQRPDYLYMLEDESDSYRNNVTFFLGYVTDTAFAGYPDANTQYLVQYTENTDSRAFRKTVHDTYFMRSYTDTDDNPRINMVTRQSVLFLQMAYILLCILPLLVVMLISIIIGRKVKSEQRIVGTLSAMGYTKNQLMRHYAAFAAIPGLLGGIVAVILSLFAAQPYSEAGLMDYEPMRVVGKINWFDAVLGIVIPTVIYSIAGILTVRKLLKKDTVLLLNGNADAGKTKNSKLLVGKKCSFRKKFALRTLVKNPGRSFVVILGAFLGCMIMLVGTGLFDSMKYAAYSSASSIGSYGHQYILNDLQTENPYGGAPVLLASAENTKGDSLILIGTDNDNLYLHMDDEKGNPIPVENGYYISSLASESFGWKQGDTVTLVNPLSMEETSIFVSGILENKVQKAIYTSREKVGNLIGLDGNYYNCLFSGEDLAIPSAMIARDSSLADVEEQLKSMISMMGTVVWIIILLGAILCITAIYVAVNMMVTENRGNISMLKVLGYQDKEIDRIVLNAHHILIPIGILVSVPAAYGMFHAFFDMFVDYGLMRMTAHISVGSYLLSIGLTVASYILSLLLLRRKIKKVDMVESLKDNRE